MQTPFFAGWNFRINEILSAILRVQLTRLDGMLEAMLAEKRTLINALDGAGPFTFNPIHDIEGDCGTTLGLLFEDEATMRAFLAGCKEEGVRADTPIDSGRHVYTNWEPVLQKQGSHNPAFDAYQLAETEVTYTKDMCPRTLDVLSRTAYLYTDPQRERAELEAMVEKVKRISEKANEREGERASLREGE
jgi:dTDP-4-amino-4,6-dideoxygalactose transaminase